jgi:uncharacterized membrane protein YdjX (TVP38/TMEM64 family)
MSAYLILFAVVLGVNLMPAFGPPTWSIIAAFGLNSDLPMPGIALAGALAAASGSLLLALATRCLRHWASERTRGNLAAARMALEHDKMRGILGLAQFALSPLPSAQLFKAAGWTGVRLLPFTLAFFSVRLISYGIYAGGAKAVQQLTFAETFRQNLASPLAVPVLVIMLAGLVALTRVSWARVFAKGK